MTSSVVENGRRVRTPPLPEGLKPLTNQVAGHFYGQDRFKKKKKPVPHEVKFAYGFLEQEDGKILKPIIPPKGPRELKFYQAINDNGRDDWALRAFRSLTPSYFGIWTTPLHPGVDYIWMENITTKFQKPSVMDIKVGPISYVPDAEQEKINREKAKFPPQEKVGYRLLGIKVYEPWSESYCVADRLSLRRLTEEEVMSKGVELYFNVGEHFRPHIVTAFIDKLRRLEDVFRAQRLYHFYATSLLFVYDGYIDQLGADPSKSPTESRRPEDLVDIRMIDFTHVREANGKTDDNYLSGVCSLIRSFQSLLPASNNDVYS